MLCVFLLVERKDGDGEKEYLDFLIQCSKSSNLAWVLATVKFSSKVLDNSSGQLLPREGNYGTADRLVSIDRSFPV